MNKQTFSDSARFPIRVPIELPQSVSSTRGQQVGDRTTIVREEPLDLQCLTTISALRDVEDVSIRTFGLWNFEQFWSVLHSCLGCKRTLVRLPVLHISGSPAMTSTTFAAVICDADEPCSLTSSPRSTTRPLCF